MNTTQQINEERAEAVGDPDVQKKGCIRMAVKARLEAMHLLQRAADSIDIDETKRLERIARGQLRWARSCEEWAAAAVR
jgi:hypothetical protein